MMKEIADDEDSIKYFADERIKKMYRRHQTGWNITRKLNDGTVFHGPKAKIRKTYKRWDHIMRKMGKDMMAKAKKTKIKL